MKVVAETPEGKEAAKRLQHVLKSLVRTGYINPKELPERLSVHQAVETIQRITGGQCS
jgi:hypothetical protein